MKAVSPEARRARDTLDTAIRRVKGLRMNWETPGHTLVLDNWRTLHAREEAQPGRELQRILVS